MGLGGEKAGRRKEKQRDRQVNRGRENQDHETKPKREACTRGHRKTHGAQKQGGVGVQASDEGG